MAKIYRRVNGTRVEIVGAEKTQIQSERAAYEDGALDRAKGTKKADVNAAKKAALAKPTPFAIDDVVNLYTPDIRTAKESRIPLMGAGAVELWRTVENVNIELTKSQLTSVCNHLKLRGDTLTTEAGRMKGEIDALETIEDVQDYLIEL